MDTTQLVSAALNRNAELIKMTLKDFSDTDMLARPVPGANHAAWQLGHLTASEAKMVAAAAGKSPELPAGFADKFSRNTAPSDDAKAFPSKQELIETFARVRQTSVAWAKTLQAADLDRESPESIRAFAPKLGDLVTVLPEHTAMHLGQFQVIRRMLGKPVLF